jgi:hypothetical protein
MLYYAGRDANWLRRNIRNGDIEAYIALFGWDRFNPRLSINYSPLKAKELEDEIQRYKQYAENFGYEQASSLTLSFVIVPDNLNLDLSNLKQWYELDAGEDFEKYTLYKAKLKQFNP